MITNEERIYLAQVNSIEHPILKNLSIIFGDEAVLVQGDRRFQVRRLANCEYLSKELERRDEDRREEKH